VEAQQISPPARDELVFTLFLAAMSRPESERGQFLREACSGDPVLLADVEHRVNWEKRLGGFLLTPILARDLIDRPFAPGDTVLRRFRILRVAGEGGMGVVYEAFDEKLGHPVALKRPRFEFRKRLSQEAVKSLRVMHSNVCRVFDFHTEETETGEIDFLTMEFLEGETLATRLPQAPTRWLATAQGKEIARQLCAGLSAIHAKGIVHRDLKANNVMLSKDETGRVRAVIMDFGIAQSADMFSSQTRGTPAYLAPELWKGQIANVRSDLYALGVLLYEMGCGHKPFPEDATWEERLQTLPPAPDVGEPLRSALLRCLAPNPERRFGSADELDRALRRFSRRLVLTAAFTLSTAAAAGAFLEQRFWPSSAIRMAILPPSIITGQAADIALVNGFVQDLSYRLKTLRTRRRLSVFPLAETRSEGANSSSQAKNLLGASHAFSSEFKRTASRWAVSANLVDTSNGRSVRCWNLASLDDDLPADLFKLQSTVVTEIARDLSLQGSPRPHTLPGAVYADYLRGIHYALVDYENAVEAVPYFEKVVASAPDSALGYAGLAQALLGARYATGDTTYEEKAQRALAEAEQLDPELAQVHLMRARLEDFHGWHEQALSEFRRAAELDEHETQAFIGMGYALLYLGRYQEAEAALQAALAAQPEYFKPYIDAGLFYHQIGNVKAAEKLWLEAVRLAPGQTRARLNLGILYFDAGRVAEAWAQASESLRIRRTLPALELQGDLFDLAHKYPEAVASYEEAIRVGPPNYKTWAALAAAYRKVGREKDALETFRRGLDDAQTGLLVNARDPDRIAWCAFYHASLDETDQARTRAQEALAIASPPAAMVRKRLVHTYDLLHDGQSALHLIEGAPPDFREELARDTGLSVALRQNPDFVRLTH
jgi:serine/threonine protein kinase/tetratricopeptide (TPR) repeat protein